MRYFIDLSYDGKNFHGWQRQPNAISIQQVVEENLSLATRKERKLVAAGRTDSGVHAEQMIAHTDFEKAIHTEELVYRLNRMLPKSIAINSIYPVKDDAHARFDAISRAYYYQITQKKNPFFQAYSAHVRKVLDIEKMQAGADLIKTYRDFKCFSKSRTDVNTYFCQIQEARWIQKGDLLVFEIKADRFLRNMVRAVVGTLVDLGAGKTSLSDLRETLESRDRGKAGKSMDAKGLFLNKISYPEKIIL